MGVATDTGMSLEYRYDANTNLEGVVSRSDDRTAPAGSVTIEGGATWARSHTVHLQLEATDDRGAVAWMSFSTDGTTFTERIPFSKSHVLLLPPGEGERTVYAVFEDSNGNRSEPATDTILLDTRPPTIEAKPPSGTYGVPQTVHLVSDDPGAKFYVAVGPSPSLADLVPASGPLEVERSTRILAVAEDAAGNRSPPLTLEYVLKPGERERDGCGSTSAPGKAVVFGLLLALLRRRWLLRLWALFALTAPLASARAAGPYFEILDLGGRGKTFANAVNRRGEVTGFSDGQAFYWHDGTMVLLGTLGGRASEGFDINDAGVIVGESETADPGGGIGVRSAFLWDGTMRRLDPRESDARGINWNGDVVGQVRVGPTSWKMALWPAGGSAVFPNANEYINGSGQHITDDGIIVGEGTMVPRKDGAIWDASGLTHLGGFLTRLYDINDEGWFTGQTGALVRPPSTYQPHAMVGFPDGNGGFGIFLLPNADVPDASSGLAIHSSGAIVGQGRFFSGTDRGYLWLPDGTGYGEPFALDDLVDPRLGWAITSGNDIAETPILTVVGAGRRGGEERGFIMVQVRLLVPTAAQFQYSGVDGDPVNTFTGEWLLDEEDDLRFEGPFPLRFQRSYRSGLAGDSSAFLGRGWTHPYAWSMTSVGDLAVARTPFGRLVVFRRIGEAWILESRRDVSYRLQEQGGRFVLYDPSLNRRLGFDVYGRLTEIVGRGGRRITVAYGPRPDGRPLRIQDDFGNVLTLTYGRSGITSVSDGTRSVTFTYEQGRLVEVTDALGQTTQYTYSSSGRLDSVVRPRGNVPYRLVYDNAGRIVEQTDAAGNVRAFTYDLGRTSISLPDGSQRAHLHSDRGVLTSIEQPNGQSDNLGYDPAGRRTEITHADGRRVEVLRDDATGKIRGVFLDGAMRVTKRFEPRSGSFSAQYDLTQVQLPDGSVSRFQYSETGLPTQVIDAEGHATRFAYDDSGRLLSVTNRLGGTVAHRYSAAALPDATIDEHGHETTYEYDAFGRRIRTIYADGSERLRSYDPAGHILSQTDELGRVTQYAYDPNGNLIRIVDPAGNTTSLEYDDMDRLVSVTNAGGGTERYGYDVRGRVSQVTDPLGYTTSLARDGSGRIVAVTDPTGGVTEYGFDGSGYLVSQRSPTGLETRFERTQQGQLARVTSPEGRVREFEYDSVGRLSRRRDPDGAVTHYEYDRRGLVRTVTGPGGIRVSMSRNGFGQVTALTDPNGSVWEYEYDTAGFLVARIDPVGAVERIEYDSRDRESLVTFPGNLGSLSLTRDPAGNLVEARYSDGTVLVSEYYARDLLVGGTNLTLGRDANGRIVETNGIGIERDAAGQITGIRFGADELVHYGYDARGNLVSVSDWLGGETVMSYDGEGRLWRLVRPNGTIRTLDYDGDGRLIAIREEDSSGLVFLRLEFQRDAAGRILGANRVGPVEAVFPSGEQQWEFGPAATVSGDRVDEMGRVVDDGRYRYEWSLASTLVSITGGGVEIDLDYDVLGHPVAIDDGMVRRTLVWNYALGIPSIEVVRNPAGDETYYVHAPDGSLLYAVDATTGERAYFHFDEMGNTVCLTDDLGMVTDAWSWGPYGEPLGHEGGREALFTYRGEYGALRLGELHLMGRRVYDPVRRRFLSRDSAVDLEAPNPLNVNPYVFAAGNPLLFVDPTGEVPSAVDRAKQTRPLERGHKVAKYAASMLGAAVTNYGVPAIERADRLALLNRLNAGKIRGMAQIAAHAESVAKPWRAARTANEFLGETVKGAGLIIKTYKEGPGPLLDEAASTFGEQVVGKTGVNVVKTGVELYKTHERVTQERKTAKRTLDATLESYVAFLDQLDRAYRVEKTITLEQYQALFEQASRAFDAQVDGTTLSSTSAIQIEALNGLIASFEAFAGL